MESEFHKLEILELPDWEFKTNVMDVLMDKVDNMQEQMDNVSKEMEILRMHQKGNAIDPNTETEMKNASDGLIGTLDVAEERICECKDTSNINRNLRNWKAKRTKSEKRERISKVCGTATKCVIYVWWEFQEEKERKEQKKHLER